MTREDAIKVCTREKECVQSALDACADGGYYVSPDEIITAFDYVEALSMAISALREKPRWISVEERLPKDERPVLAYYGFNNDGDGDLGMMFIGTLCYFCFDHNPHWQHASHNLVVTHWMHLPEPPEVEV